MMALFYVYYSMSVILLGANINLDYLAQQLILAHAGDGRKICYPKWHITAAKYPVQTTFSVETWKPFKKL